MIVFHPVFTQAKNLTIDQKLSLLATTSYDLSTPSSSQSNTLETHTITVVPAFITPQTNVNQLKLNDVKIEYDRGSFYPNTTTTSTTTAPEERNTQDDTQTGRKKGMVCTDAKQHHLLATYDENGDCVIKSCVAGYDLDENSKTCVKDNSNKLTKELKQAINELTTEFQTKVSQLQNDGGDK